MSVIFITLLKSSTTLLRVIWTPNSKLLDGFEPIVESREALDRIADGKLKKQYIWPFLLTAYCILDTIYYLLTSGYHPEEPEMIHHVITGFLPMFFRHQNDIMFSGSFTAVFLLYFIRLIDRMPHAGKVIMYRSGDGTLVSPNGQKIDKALNDKLTRFWRKTKVRHQYLFYIVEMESDSAYTYPLLAIEFYKTFVISGHFRFRWIYCGVVIGIYLHYVMTAIQAVTLFIWLNFILAIKQNHYLQRMQFRSFRCFEETLRTLFNHAEEIRLWNNFYRRPLTILILAFGFISGCLFNSSLHAPEVPFVFVIPWIVFGFFYFFLIFVFAATSSHTIHLNKKLLFKLRNQLASICTLRKVPFRRRIVRLDLANEYKVLLLKTCFRFWTSSTLNNRLFFFEFLGLLSMVYMKTLEYTIS